MPRSVRTWAWLGSAPGFSFSYGCRVFFLEHHFHRSVFLIASRKGSPRLVRPGALLFPLKDQMRCRAAALRSSNGLKPNLRGHPEVEMIKFAVAALSILVLVA